MDTQNAEKLKQKLQKTTLSPKKNAILFYEKSPSWSDLFWNPLTYTSPARENCFLNFSLPVSSFFSRHLPAPFRSDGNGEVVFFIISKTRFSAETRVGRARARARVDAAAGSIFATFTPLEQRRFGAFARAIKSHRPKGIHF